MNDLITAATSGLFVEIGKVIEHMKAQQTRIADLERENARLDAALDEEISNRDQYHEWADRLAAEIARYFGVDIGEHSNANNPWEQAYEAVPAEASAPAVERKPVAVIQQINEVNRTAVVTVTASNHWDIDVAIGDRLYAAPQAFPAVEQNKDRGIK